MEWWDSFWYSKDSRGFVWCIKKYTKNIKEMVFLDCYVIILSLYQWNKIVLRLQWHIGHSDKYFESVLTNVTDVTASSTVDSFLQRHAPRPDPVNETHPSATQRRLKQTLFICQQDLTQVQVHWADVFPALFWIKFVTFISLRPAEIVTQLLPDVVLVSKSKWHFKNTGRTTR